MGQTSPTLLSRFHELILGLLFVILLGTLTMVGLLVSRPKPEPPAVTAVACQSYIDAAVADAGEGCEIQAEPNEPMQAQSVPAREGRVGFVFPVEWSTLTGNNISTQPSWYAHLMYGHIPMCDACDGPLLDVSMAVADKKTLPASNYADFHAYVVSQYTDPSYSNVVITPSDDVGGERYTVTGQQNGLFVGPFEAIYFEGPNLYASIIFLDKDVDDMKINEGWEIIKDSLDFSGLQQ